MKRATIRATALCVLVLVSIVVPACATYDGEGSDVTVGVGVAVYGGYYGPGWGGGCCYGPVGGVGVPPPIHAGPRPRPY